jgi:hypothetical protein
MIERFSEQEYTSSVVCILDTLYNVSLYIKIEMTQFEEAFISFHENNINGISETNNLIRHSNSSEDDVFIFGDECTASYGNNKCNIKVIMMRGVKELPITLVGSVYQNGFIVSRRDIDNVFLSYCNDYVKDLYTSNLNIDFNKVNVFSMLQQISFTLYGRDTFSSISLLIDSEIAQDPFTRPTADFALVTFIANLKLTVSQRDELRELIQERYTVSAYKNIDVLLSRVYAALDNLEVL